ncbi:hypothetical protein ACYPKM_04045 [Pseudomonas aeruginosa]
MQPNLENQAPIIIRVVLWVDGKMVEAHEFPIPRVGEKGFYRTTVSYDAFRNRERRRLYEAHKSGSWFAKGKLCIVDLKSDVEERFNLLRESIGKFESNANKKFAELELPLTTHKNLWDFYSYIGYDYKSQKYTEASSKHSKGGMEP